jgi:hypothetical protein
LIEEKENKSKLFDSRDPDVGAAKTLKYPQKNEVPISR